jgi:hypothetical protein
MKLISSQRKDNTSEYLLIFCFIVIIAVFLIAHSGKILAPIFPISALVVGVFLQQRNPALYVGFTWWLWFLSPVIRRMIDYYAGTYTYGPWHLTPMLVTSLTIVSLFRHGPREFKGYGRPILISAIGVLYGALVTYAQSDMRVTVLGTLGWLSPIAFCFYLYINWRSYPEIKSAVQNSFISAMPVMGLYGIYQYVVAPAWDCFYLNNPTTTTSFGLPEPFGIRVFGTMDAPHTLGACMAVGVYMIIASPANPFKYLGLISGFLTLLLTSARTIWIGIIIGIFSLLPNISWRRRFGFIILAVVVGFIVYSLAMSEPFYETITKRFESLQDSDDGSFSSRKDALNSSIILALFEFVGKGFEATNIILEGGVPVSDNGIFLIIFGLGIIGAIPYLFGFISLSYSLFNKFDFKPDEMLSISRTVITSTAFQALFVAVTESAFSMVLWGFIGMGIISIRYSQYNHDYQSQNELKIIGRHL